MADTGVLDATEKPDSNADFVDPLGATNPFDDDIEPDIDDADLDNEPLKSSDIDAMLEASRQEFQKLGIQTSDDKQDDDDDDDNEKDLFVSVDNPEKHTTTMESYITFRVNTRTTRSEFDNSEFQVRRRYNDFVWFRQRLEDSQPTHIIPPLPEKHSLRRLERFSPEFVKTRMAALQQFLRRVADHPVLSFNKHFHTFLTAKQWEFQAAKKEGSGFISRITDSFHSRSASYMMKNRLPEFTLMNEYTHIFGEKMGVLDRIAQRINKEEYDFLADLNEWGPVFTLWSNSEGPLSPALGAVAKAVESNFLALQEMVDATESEFNNPVKEYQLYAEAIKAVLRRRDAIQMEQEMATEELNKKKEEDDQMKSSRSSSLFSKTPEAIQADLQELTGQVNTLSDKMVCSNADFKADMDRWHRNKQKDFREIFTKMADRKIEYYQKLMKIWEETIPQIQNCDLERNGIDRSTTSSSVSHDPDLDNHDLDVTEDNKSSSPIPGQTEIIAKDEQTPGAPVVAIGDVKADSI